jgi:arginyl-tRNA synthetase
MNLLQFLKQQIHQALQDLVADPSPYVAMVKPAQDARHGDYQANCAMALAKELGRKPRDIAEEIVKRIPAGEALEVPEIAGPGFINLRLRPEWLEQQLPVMAREERLGVAPASPPRTVVIDFSSPNVAKPMHVGHLRSTIIGDSLARLLRLLGHRVITDNHLGDWGTQFGMLLYGYKHFRDEEALKADPVREMARLYIHVRGLMDAEQGVSGGVVSGEWSEEENAGSATTAQNPPLTTHHSPTVTNPVAEAVRQETAKLHAGDPENVRLWQMFMPWCREEIDRIYRRLDVHFDYTHGESFYNPMLPEVVRSLLERGIAQESEEAVVIFLRENEPPALIRKKDGAFTYTTSDLATIRYRVQTWNPEAILYVVDFRQALHFKNLFEAARRWGYDKVELEHISFGSVLGPDRRPIKTREGGAIELGQLLDEAAERGRTVYEQTRAERVGRGEDVPDLSAEERRQIAEVVGLGAVKYADLSQNRTSDYIFNWDKMLAMDGNTATYMQYAYARVRSIFRKGGDSEDRYRSDPPAVSLGKMPAERALALQILRLNESLEVAALEYKPNLITAYLWDLAKAYSSFYDSCPVLKAETMALRQSRLLLCDLTARVIHKGLELLGIQTVERM